MYNHFDGQGRAPPGVNTDDKNGKCPLYDQSHERKDQQVDKAEKEAMAKVRAEHPDLSEEDLKIKFAKAVQSSSNPHAEDHRHHGHIPPHHHNHRRHGPGVRDPFMAALYNRQPVAALDAVFEGAGNMLDEFGVIDPHAVQQVQEQGRRAREQMRAVQQAQHQRAQLQAAALMRQQQAVLVQQDAQREDLRRRLEQARQATQTNRARVAALDAPFFLPFGPQAVDAVRPRHNDQTFGNNAGAPNVGFLDNARARRQSNEIHRAVEERLRGLGEARNLNPPAQGQEINDLRRRTAESNADRVAERVAEWRRFNSDPFDLDPPPRMPGENPRAPRRRNPAIPGVWVPGANDQAYL